KAVSARAATARVYEAMMLLGGNGIEERFNALPRLWRDAAIIESWEGPYTLLLMQALEDLARYRVACREEAFLRHGLGEHFEGALAAELARILAEPEAPDAMLAFGELAPRLHARFEARALAELRASR
ncbi:MAG TPA: acyl-CoA dehydrogenase family protein, partial [Myxococcota bacterium]|nr:acyl-CoA dehydrogenase family protein [Myxococcota bacterium]